MADLALRLNENTFDKNYASDHAIFHLTYSKRCGPPVGHGLFHEETVGGVLFFAFFFGKRLNILFRNILLLVKTFRTKSFHFLCCRIARFS